MAFQAVLDKRSDPPSPLTLSTYTVPATTAVTFLRIQFKNVTEGIEHEESFPTNPNMTYFTFAKAEIIAFDVGTSGKRKRSILFRFSSYRKS